MHVSEQEIQVAKKYMKGMPDLICDERCLCLWGNGGSHMLLVGGINLTTSLVNNLAMSIDNFNLHILHLATIHLGVHSMNVLRINLNIL